MLDDFAKEVKAQLYERARSPLFVSYLLALAGWNFRSLLYLVSDLKVAEKLARLDSIYASAYDIATLLFLFPAGSAVLFLLAYPYPARWAYEYWQRQHVKVKAIQQAIEDSTPLTLEEARVLRKSAIESQIALQQQLQAASTSNREILAQKDLAMTRVQELETGLNGLREENRRYIERIKQLEEEAAHKGVDKPPKNSSIDQEIAEALTEDALESPEEDVAEEIVREGRVPRPPRAVIARSGLALTLGDLPAKVYFELVALDGEAATYNELAQLAGLSRIETEYAVKKLGEQKLVLITGGKVSLTSAGKELALDQGIVVRPRVRTSRRI